MSELIGNGQPQILAYRDNNLRRYLQGRNLPNRDIKFHIERYNDLQLRTERILWKDYSVIDINQIIPDRVFTGSQPIPEGLLGRISQFNELPTTPGKLNTRVIEHDIFSSADITARYETAPRLSTGQANNLSLVESVLDLQGPIVKPIQKASLELPYSIFIAGPYSRFHLSQGAVFFPGVSACLTAVFKDRDGAISATHMHRVENPQMQDMELLLQEHATLFGSKTIAGGHLTLAGMGFPWNMLTGYASGQKPDFDLLYPSPGLKQFASAHNITLARPRVATNQRVTSIGQLFATTNPSDPTVWTTQTYEGKGFTITPPGYPELVRKIDASYEI